MVQRAWCVEFCRDLGPAGSFTDHTGITAAAQGQLKGINQDRLTGPCLAGEHRKACLPVHIQRGDDHEVA